MGEKCFDFLASGYSHRLTGVSYDFIAPKCWRGDVVPHVFATSRMDILAGFGRQSASGKEFLENVKPRSTRNLVHHRKSASLRRRNPQASRLPLSRNGP